MAKIFNLRIHWIDLTGTVLFFNAHRCSMLNRQFNFAIYFSVLHSFHFIVWHMSTNHYQTHPLNQLRYIYLFFFFHFIHTNESQCSTWRWPILCLTVKFVSLNKIIFRSDEHLKICDANDFLWLDFVKLIWQLNNNDNGDDDNAKWINKERFKNTIQPCTLRLWIRKNPINVWRVTINCSMFNFIKRLFSSYSFISNSENLLSDER